MTRINQTEAIKWAQNTYTSSSTITSYPANSARKAFCTVRFASKFGGADKSFQVSKKTYANLAATGLFKIGKYEQ